MGYNLVLKPFIKNKGIQSIKSYKIFDCIEFPTNECFVDVRVDFDGIGTIKRNI